MHPYVERHDHAYVERYDRGVNDAAPLTTDGAQYIVPIRCKNRRFKPTVFGSVLALVGVLGGIRLGMWQLDRAEEKQQLLDQFARGQSQTLALRAEDAEQLGRYQRVRAVGRYDVEHQILLDNMPSATGRAGFRVLTPLQLADDRWILVDRGWVPMGATRTELPDVRIAEQPSAVTGRLDDLPLPGMRLGENAVLSSDAPWPRVLSFPRHAELEQVLERRLLPRILLLDAAEPQGYERVWGTNMGIGPPRHIAYAVQWFALAFAMLCAYVIVSFKMEAQSNER